ncbi:MAG TPA: hypothetical protein IAD32_09345 [Candidatus Scatavimonas merdigallinarum]|uniref:Uncharacterized protein n=1 Tax=Candidatus Scatavimonas merdigallinarum TaxID=2840914 RepID=A0A9D1CUZ8_9FIRM|nr:hypothetical protein [Candidatus Scatavimonas merdigallinarum]
MDQKKVKADVERIEQMQVPLAHIIPEFIGLLIMSFGMRSYATESAGAMATNQWRFRQQYRSKSKQSF